MKRLGEQATKCNSLSFEIFDLLQLHNPHPERLPSEGEDLSGTLNGSSSRLFQLIRRLAVTWDLVSTSGKASLRFEGLFDKLSGAVCGS